MQIEIVYPALLGLVNLMNQNAFSSLTSCYSTLIVQTLMGLAWPFKTCSCGRCGTRARIVHDWNV